MSFFEKIKLKMLSPENREKYLLEKEKKERAENRKKQPSVTSDPVQEKKAQNNNRKVVRKIKKVPVSKIDKKEDEEINEKVDKEERNNIKEDNEEINNIKEDNSSSDKDFDNKNSEEEKSSKSNISDKYKESLSRLNEIKSKLDKDDAESNDELEEIDKLDEDLLDEDKNNNSNSDLEYNNTPLNIEDEEYKKELVLKKAEEKEKYFDILIDLPPTSDIDKIIRLALERGVPEWFLREEGYMVDDDDFDFDEDNNSEIENVNEDLTELDETKVDTILGSEELETDVNREFTLGDDLIVDVSSGNDKREFSLGDDLTVEEVSDDGKREFTLDDDLTVEEVSHDDKRDFSLGDDSTVSVELDNEDESINELEEDTVIDVEDDKLEQETSVKRDEDIGLTDVPVTLGNTSINKQQESEKEEKSDRQKSKRLESRLEQLAKLRVKREVINVSGDKVLVKEEKEDSQGNKKSKYSSYRVDNGHVDKVSVGNEIDENVPLEKIEEPLIIDGKKYDISKEEEEKIFKLYGTREIWIITKDSEYVTDLQNKLENTRYKVSQISNNKDFIFATRNTDNLIVITQLIPNAVKTAFVSYLKYLNEEKMKARLVSVKDSLVTADIIEHVFDDLTKAELDEYYNQFDALLYGESKKTINEILKVISFDLTDELDKDLTFEIDNLDLGNSKQEVVLDLELNEIDLGEENLDIDLGNELKELDLGEGFVELEEEDLK